MVRFGPLAFLYNIMRIWLVQSLSAEHTVFAGNFNKAAIIVLAMCSGTEDGPWKSSFFDEDGKFVGWAWVRAAAILGNPTAFNAYRRPG